MSYTPEEQAQHRELWAQALESDEFEQTRGALHDDDGYCCFGVACEVYKREGGVLTEEVSPRGTVAYEGRTLLLPPKVRFWLGLRESDGSYGSGSCLTDDNDTGRSFEWIAERVRNEPEGLLSASARRRAG